MSIQYIVWNANDSGNGTLRNAISNANSHYGAEVKIVINGTITLLSNIEIQSTMTINGPDSGTIIIQNNVITDKCFTLVNTNSNIYPTMTVNMNKLIFTGASRTINQITLYTPDTSVTLNINYCNFINFISLSNSINIINTNGNLNLSYCEFVSNSEALIASKQVTISNSNFMNNTAPYTTTRLITIIYNGLLTLTDCLFDSCSMAQYIMFGATGKFIFKNTNFINNTTDCISTSQEIEMDNCQALNNTITGTMFVFMNNNSVITNCIFNDNNSYGILYFQNNENIVLSYCKFNNNQITIAVLFNNNVSNSNYVLNNLEFDNNIAIQNPSIEISTMYQLSTSNIIKIFNVTVSNSNGIYAMTLGPNTSVNNILMINCTISSNICSGLLISQLANVTIIGCTISANGTEKMFGIISDSTNIVCNIGNTVVAYNNIDSETTDISFNDQTSITSLGYNFIGNATGVTNIFSKPGDQYGIDGAPINPYLLPVANNGGFTTTMMTETVPVVSPLINAGSNSIVNTYYIYPEVLNLGQPIDQRGYTRIYLGSVDIGSVENSSVVCISGDAIIKVLDRYSDKIIDLPLSKIYSGSHLLYYEINDEYVDIIYNAITGTTSKFVKIEKDLISINVPDKDTYMTPGHLVIINGKETKAINIPGAKIINLQSQRVYTICTQDRIYFYANNMKVLSWNAVDFVKNMQRKNIIWKDNKKEYLKLLPHIMVE